MDSIINKNETDERLSDTTELSDVERRRIKENIERTDTEKFLLFCRMMRVNFMLKNAIIIEK